MLPDRLLKILTSLRLTVVLLAFAILLVFIGTIAQVDEGLYNAQTRYFHQWLVFGPNLFGKRIPVVIPGGYLLGSLLLLNLVAAHIYRFQLTRKKIGIQLAHLGVILLLVGQLMTDMLAHESEMRLAEGETKSYSVSGRQFELVFTTPTAAGREKVVAIPASSLARDGIVRNDNLPFTIRVKKYYRNSEPTFRAPMMKEKAPPLTTNGIAESFDFRPVPEVKTMDDRNVPTAVIELEARGAGLGDWVVSGWAGDEGMLDALARSYSSSLGTQIGQSISARMKAAQSVEVEGKKFTFVLRPQRVYHPFSITLLKATHTIYPGTDIPKDFRSRVRINNPQTGENREAEIYMNKPLRYAGLTFYQYQMGAGEAVRAAGDIPNSTLQVVRNPGWITPYLGCLLVGAGLVVQFLYHLVGFVSKRKTQLNYQAQRPAAP